jgi:hypothetical protein
MITDHVAEEQPSPPRPEHVESGFEEARARVTDLEHRARTLIRQRPIVAVLAALGVGYLAARVVSRALR